MQGGGRSVGRAKGASPWLKATNPEWGALGRATGVNPRVLARLLSQAWLHWTSHWPGLVCP
jgi:hypothetical protein